MMQAGIRNIMDNFQDTEPTQAVNTKLFMHSIRIQQVISPPAYVYELLQRWQLSYPLSKVVD